MDGRGRIGEEDIPSGLRTLRTGGAAVTEDDDDELSSSEDETKSKIKQETISMPEGMTEWILLLFEDYQRL